MIAQKEAVDDGSLEPFHEGGVGAERLKDGGEVAAVEGLEEGVAPFGDCGVELRRSPVVKGE